MIHWHTTGRELQKMLRQIMVEPLFDPFFLVGGTSLSLQWGHRLSVDIDLFTDSTYGQIDFSGLVAWFRDHYAYVALELPIACSEYPAMRDLLGEDAAWFDPASIASVAEALRALISDPQRRIVISQHNRSKAAAYDWDRVTREAFAFLRGRVG